MTDANSSSLRKDRYVYGKAEKRPEFSEKEDGISSAVLTKKLRSCPKLFAVN